MPVLRTSLLLIFRIEEFAYTSQEMYLTIDNITSTSLYTCSYEFSDGSVLSDVVYAVLRPTSEYRAWVPSQVWGISALTRFD